ncbi:MAG TPA: RNA 2',3'-cyclic phosphodiesterase [Acidimicrobiia bacterium]|nr:RNA 2',3'-cyclic phosphodiesterase [Acidimicrobiia bacterium]
MRLFVAVRPPDDVIAAVEVALAPARRSMVGPKWTTPEQWHVTLQFLGQVPEEAVGDVAHALEAVSKVPPFPIRLAGGGGFPRAERARVVWLGVGPGGDRVAELAHSVNGALEPLGLLPEDRPYHPHLTLARLKVSGDVGPAIEALGTDPVGKAFVVDEVVLYESKVSRAGTRYETVATVPLEG